MDLHEKKEELARYVTYAEQLRTKAESSGLTTDERADLNKTLEKAESLKTEIEEREADVAVEERVKAIGVKLGANPSTEIEQVPRYKDAVQAFFKSEAFLDWVADFKAGRRTQSEAVEFKAADVTADQAGDLVTQYAPGIANLNYRFPLRVGDLFSPDTMDGSNISFLKMPNDADADAQYQSSLGAQKGGTFVANLDIATVYAATVAAVATIPAQNLEDISALEGEVRQILTVGPNGVGEVLEDEYLNGSGGSSAIEGVLSLSPDDSTLAGTYNSLSVFKAVADIAAATGFQADAVVVHPDDWFLLSTEVGSVDDRPMFGPWGTGWGSTPGGLPPLVVSRKIASGTALIGAFKASTKYTRHGLRVTADASGLGLRDKNLVLFVAETREALVHRYGKDPYRTVTITS